MDPIPTAISSRKQGQFPNHGLAFSRESDPRVTRPGVNHLLGVSLGPIGCLGTRPSGLKPKGEERSSPANICPTGPGEMGRMLLATGPGGPSGSPQSGKETAAPHSGSPSLKGEAILALTGAPTWQEAGLSRSWGERT